MDDLVSGSTTTKEDCHKNLCQAKNGLKAHTACEKEGESLALLGHGRREMLIAVIARHCLSHAQAGAGHCSCRLEGFAVWLPDRIFNRT